MIIQPRLKIFLTVLLGAFFPLLLSAQLTANDSSSVFQDHDQALGTVTFGILQGGGSLIGADVEIMTSKHLGIQMGIGIIGFGASINYHPRGHYRSSSFGLNYWSQGHGPHFVQSLVGPSYKFRGKKWFTAQIGLGYQIKKGPGAARIEPINLPKVQLTYSIGGYIPIH